MELISPKSFLYSESVNCFMKPATISFLVLFFEFPTKIYISHALCSFHITFGNP